MAKQKNKKVEQPGYFEDKVLPSIISGTIVAIISTTFALFLKKQFEADVQKVNESLVTVSNIVKSNQLINQTEITNLKQVIKQKTSQKITGHSNQAIANTGNNNTNILNNELKPDFKTDSENSNIAANHLEEGQTLLNSTIICGKDANPDKFRIALEVWYSATLTDLKKITRKAASVFAAARPAPHSFVASDGCNNEIYQNTIVLQAKLDVLKEIVKGL
jgi:hypothetical protein